MFCKPEHCSILSSRKRIKAEPKACTVILFSAKRSGISQPSSMAAKINSDFSMLKVKNGVV